MARESPLGVGVLASGTGSLLQAILDAQDDLYRVVVVLSDRRGVKALERTERAGVPAVVVDWKAFGPQRRDEFSRACGRALRERGVELACSAGFMRILTPVYFEALGVPAMNSHPSLLPSFPGAHAVRDALSWGAKITGTTIHFVDEEVDHGPIIVQEAVALEPGDTEETLHERVKAVERRLYPDVIRLFARGRLKIEGRRVHVIG